MSDDVAVVEPEDVHAGAAGHEFDSVIGGGYISGQNNNKIGAVSAKQYGPKIIDRLRIIYILGIVLWIFILIFVIWGKGQRSTSDNLDLLELTILAMPIIVYLFSINNLKYIDPTTEDKFFAVNYLSIGLLVIVPLLTWSHDTFKKNDELFSLMLLAIILAVFSIIDVWVSPEWFVLLRHIRSMLQIASLSLIIYALYLLYMAGPYREDKAQGNK
jgi:hypothetical protein